jgi:3-deoxy-manno-octulosonate cytidylyltransferase (CMP-KDO synthetase)
MKTAVIIPARMGSTRFRGKPLVNICGMPMIEHVYQRCSMAAGVEGVYIATCDEEIRVVVEKFGGQVIMTADTHQRASERTAEAVEKIDVDIVVMVQGDEPLTHPDMISLAAQPLIDDPEIVCANLTSKIHSLQEFKDPNTIKVVMDNRGFALYFSREPVPTTGVQGFFDNSQVPLYKQVCIIPFRKEFLLRYVKMDPTPLEMAESIDMLRLLENGYKVKMVESSFDTHAVDTPEDLRLVEQMMEKDPLFAQYVRYS